jgi:hypothetical protein
MFKIFKNRSENPNNFSFKFIPILKRPIWIQFLVTNFVFIENLLIYLSKQTNKIECGQEFELETMAHRVTHLKYLSMIADESGKQKQKSETLVMVNCSQRINILYKIVNTKLKLVKKLNLLYIFDVDLLTIYQRF